MVLAVLLHLQFTRMTLPELLCGTCSQILTNVEQCVESTQPVLTGQKQQL